jgi:hypothetical protein
VSPDLDTGEGVRTSSVFSGRRIGATLVSCGVDDKIATTGLI